MARNPQEVADKWVNNLSAASKYITDGVNQTTVAPSQLAIAKQDKMVANFVASVNSGKWANNLGKHTLQQWKTDMITKGIPRIASGAAASKGKFATFMSSLLPYIEAGQATIEQMPNNTFEQSVQRAVAWMNYMHGYKKP